MLHLFPLTICAVPWRSFYALLLLCRSPLTKFHKVFSLLLVFWFVCSVKITCRKPDVNTHKSITWDNASFYKTINQPQAADHGTKMEG